MGHHNSVIANAEHDRCSRYEMSRGKALELFASKGFGQVSMRELATHLGLTAGSLYHHFPSKQHLLFDLIEEHYDELQALLDSLQRRARSGGEVLPAIVEGHYRLYREQPLLFRLSERDVDCLNEDQQAEVVQSRMRYERTLMALLGVPATHPRAGSAGHVIAGLLSSLPEWLDRQPMADAQVLQLMQSLVNCAIKDALENG
jgi:AcrR family transcriptional regulator